MSRHVAQLPQGKVVCGWDPPLQTYFAQIHDHTRDEDDQVVVWIGCQAHELPTIQELLDAIGEDHRQIIADFGLELIEDRLADRA